MSATAAFSKAHRQYASSVMLSGDAPHEQEERRRVGVEGAVGAPAAASPRRSSVERLPATRNSEPNDATIRYQSEIGTSVPTTPATARSTNPAATTTMSTTATCLSQ